MTPFRRGAAGEAPITASEVVHDAVGQMVQQFADPYAFLRELVQNSIDAGATAVTVRLDAGDARGADYTVALSVRDDGSGMDQDMITRCLLVLFRSSKDNDPTKIGKFGVGFFSVFAMRPEVVTVETGRDTTHPGLKLSLRPDYTYDLEEHAPRRGTVVTLTLPRKASELHPLATKCHEALARWCPHVAVALTLETFGIEGAPERTTVNGPLRLDAPVQLRFDDPGGTTHLLGLSSKAHTRMYNRGILLHSAPEALVPGVAWTVESPKLHHTVSRDGVRQDDAYRALVARAKALVAGPLREHVAAAFAEYAARCVTARRARVSDPEATEALQLLASAAREGPCAVKPDALAWPLCDKVEGSAGDGLTARLESGWFRAPVRYAAARPDALTAALAAQGTAVIDLGAAGTDAAEALERLFFSAYGDKAAKAAEVFSLVRFAGIARETDTERALLRALGPMLRAVDLEGAAFCTVVGAARGRLALPVAHDHPGLRGVASDDLQRADTTQTARAVALVRDHPRVMAAVSAAAHAPDLAALVLARFVLLQWGALTDARDATLQRHAVLGAEAAR